MGIRKVDYNKIINYLIIFYAFLIPISRAGISIVSTLIIILWILNGGIKKSIKLIQESKILLSLVAFIILGYISILWVDYDILYSLDRATKPLRLLLLPLLVIATTLKKENISKVITAFLIGMLISEICSYGIFFQFWQCRHGNPSDPTPFMHHLDYATFLTFTSLLLLNRFFNTDNWKLKFFYFIYFLFVTSNLFLNGGRTGHLAFAISIFAVGFTNIKNKIKAFFSMFLLVVFIFYAAYNISPVFKHRFNQGAGEVTKISKSTKDKYKGSFGQRLGAWIIAIDMFKDNPILGTGKGDEMVDFKKYVKKAPKEFKYVYNIAHFHNEYVHILISLGLIGLGLYLYMWYNLFKMQLYEKFYDNLKIIFIAVISSASLVELTMHNQFPMALFSLFVGIFISIRNYNLSSQ